jgi:integrase
MMHPRARARASTRGNTPRLVLDAGVFSRVGTLLSTSLLAGIPVHVVAARLGHTDPSITLRVYAHVLSDQLTEAADIFARTIAGTA